MIKQTTKQIAKQVIWVITIIAIAITTLISCSPEVTNDQNNIDINNSEIDKTDRKDKMYNSDKEIINSDGTSIIERFSPPEGFERILVEDDSLESF